MNVHEEWTDKLSDYLDGELSANEHRAVEAHLRGCADCAAVLADLKRVVARAQQAGAVPRPPSADLWAGVAARIENDGASGVQRRGTVSADRLALRSRRIALTLPQLAAAAALVAAVSGGIVWRAVERTAARPQHQAATTAPLPTVAEPSRDGVDSGDRVVPVGMADAQY